MSALSIPSPTPVADGYSLSEEKNKGDDTVFPFNVVASTAPKNDDDWNSQPGEYRGDTSQYSVPITRSVYLWVICASLNSCNLGYDIGVNTSAGPVLQADMSLTNLELEIFFGSINFFAMIGAILAFTISDRLGRRHAFVVAAIHFVFGLLVISMSQSYGALMFGRVFVGLGVGFGLALDPLYIAEISPAAHRGEMVTWSEIAINLGIILGFASGMLVGEMSDGMAWRSMFFVGSLLPIIMIFLATCVMVESPRWLVTKGRDEEAIPILRQIYGEGFDVTSILSEIKDALAREELAGKNIGWYALFAPSPAIRRMLLLGIGIAVAQQAVGIDAIQYFLSFILEKSGITSQFSKTGFLILLGFVKLVFIIIGGKLFDRVGRRPLFFLSLFGMSIALFVLSFNFLGQSNAAITIISLAAYLSFFSIGLGPGAWLIPSEIFSMSIRAKAMSLATFMNRLAATCMSSSFLSVANAMTWSGFFLMLAFVCILCLLFLYIYLPETRGRSLEDMTVYFAEITGDNTLLDADARLAQERVTPVSVPESDGNLGLT